MKKTKNKSLKKKKASFADLIKVMARLRAPGGCPWDRKQTHKSLLKYLVEESDELAHAVDNDDLENLEEELGDVLLQVLFHAQIASERGDFDIFDVLTTLKNKLVRRHPHVFNPQKGDEKLTPEEVKVRWKKIKEKEKREKKRARR